MRRYTAVEKGSPADIKTILRLMRDLISSVVYIYGPVSAQPVREIIFLFLYTSLALFLHALVVRKKNEEMYI